MLFNSNEFVLGFLPATVLVFFVLGRFSRNLALGWVIVASTFFYAVWRPSNLWIIGFSLVVNYAFAQSLIKLAASPERARWRAVVLALGIAFNVLLLGYFKYANFSLQVLQDLTGSHYAFQNIVLPLGISFITFQKIALLVDVATGRIQVLGVRNFLLFVMFFPQLIAGPIVHYRETVPQFERANCRFDARTFAMAITLFATGLFKKVMLADTMSDMVAPLYHQAAQGEHLYFLDAWLAALGFTVQIYFDFSAYSDMACASALFFGIRLPTNFDSPLKTGNFIDFWARWHMTLTRFLTSYIFNPIAFALTRARAKRKLPVAGARNTPFGVFVLLIAAPVILTMTIAGLWHGAGYTFIIFGLLHGLYITFAHISRQYFPRPSSTPKGAIQLRPIIACVGVVVAASIANVFFRSDYVGAAVDMLKSMVGLHGAALPAQFFRSFARLGGLLGIALLMPNILQLLAAYQPTLDTPKRPAHIGGIGPVVTWHPNWRWMIFAGCLAAVSMSRLIGKSEFLYWQF